MAECGTCGGTGTALVCARCGQVTSGWCWCQTGEPEEVTCPHCLGTGAVHTDPEPVNDPNARLPPEPMDQVCGVCFGLGGCVYCDPG